MTQNTSSQEKNIAIIAPSSPLIGVSQIDLDTISSSFQSMGYHCCFAPHLLSCQRFLAGSDAERAEDIHWAFSDSKIHAIMTFKGGYGSNRLLNLLDYHLIQQHPKPFFTFSDGTALQTALFTQAGLPAFTGFQANFFLRNPAKRLTESLAHTLSDPTFQADNLTICIPGKAQGISVGGTLSVLTGLIGTPYFPDMKNKILILEEVKEEPYKVDRMLSQLKSAGVFQQVSGVVLGDFSTCLASDPNDGSIEEVLQDYFTSLSVPVAQNLPYGHNMDHLVIPMGIPLLLDNSASSAKGTLSTLPSTKISI